MGGGSSPQGTELRLSTLLSPIPKTQGQAPTFRMAEGHLGGLNKLQMVLLPLASVPGSLQAAALCCRWNCRPL